LEADMKVKEKEKEKEDGRPLLRKEE